MYLKNNKRTNKTEIDTENNSASPEGWKVQGQIK